MMRPGLLASVIAGSKRSRRATVGTPPEGGVVTASLIASRSTGPAPLFVHLDASGTTCDSVDDPYSDIEYSFSDNDPGSPVHLYDGASKKVQVGGPIWGRVFDDAGTYTITVTATVGIAWVTGRLYRVGKAVRQGGNTYVCAIEHTSGTFATDLAASRWTLLNVGTVSDTAQVYVVVSSADSWWSAANTIYVDPSATYADTIVGCVQQTTLPSASGYNGKRVLLARGQTFGAITTNYAASNCRFEARGSGAIPSIASFQLGTNTPPGSIWPNDASLVDVRVRGSISINISGAKLLVHRCIQNTANANNTINIGGSLSFSMDNDGLPASAYSWPTEICISDHTQEGDTGNDSSPNIGAVGFFIRSAIMGTELDKADEHGLRIYIGHKTFVGHNNVTGEHYVDSPGPAGIRVALKIQGSGNDPYTSDNVGTTGREVATSKLVVANNRFGSAAFPGSWLTAAAPENADPGTVQGVEDLILENNEFDESGTYVSSAMQWRGRRLTARGNTRTGGGTPEIQRNGSSYDAENWDGPYDGNTV